MQSVLKDGRISLYLEYYLGRSETPELDADGNQVYYTDGAMAGKPKYKVKHVRKKENLNLYLYANPKDQRERMQNRNTLAFAEKTRFEREQRFLEDREGYKFRRDTNVNFPISFRNSSMRVETPLLILMAQKSPLTDSNHFSPKHRNIRHIQHISDLTSLRRR